MNVDNGDVGTLEEMEKKYGVKNPRVVSIPSEKKELSVIKQWGRKKRERYAELVKEGFGNEECFVIVEEHKGVVPESMVKVK